MWSVPLTHGHRAETIFASGTARDERAERERAARRKRRGRAECSPQRCLVCQWLTKRTIYPHACPWTLPPRYRYIHKVDRQIQRGEAILAWTDPFIRGGGGGDSSSSFSFSIIYLSIFPRWTTDRWFFLSYSFFFFFLGKIERFFLLLLLGVFGNFCRVIDGNIFKVILGDLWRETMGREFGSEAIEKVIKTRIDL